MGKPPHPVTARNCGRSIPNFMPWPVVPESMLSAAPVRVVRPRCWRSVWPPRDSSVSAISGFNWGSGEAFDDPAGQVSGFSLHAGVAAKTHQRQKLERLCRYIALLQGRRVLRRLGTIASAAARRSRNSACHSRPMATSVTSSKRRSAKACPASVASVVGMAPPMSSSSRSTSPLLRILRPRH